MCTAWISQDDDLRRFSMLNIMASHCIVGKYKNIPCKPNKGSCYIKNKNRKNIVVKSVCVSHDNKIEEEKKNMKKKFLAAFKSQVGDKKQGPEGASDESGGGLDFKVESGTNYDTFVQGIDKALENVKTANSSKKDDDGKPLLEDDQQIDAKQKEMDDEEKEAAETASWLKSLAGIPGNDPADSKWLKLDVLDHNTGVREPRGQLCVNIQLWPKDKAIVMPVGARRDEPNTNPYLPPPVGRLKWSWNPFVLGSQLCGPWICAQVFCCLISITFVVLMIFCQPFLTLMINIIFFFG